MNDHHGQPDSNAAATLMTDGYPIGTDRLLLGLDGYTLSLSSNSAALLTELQEYFRAFVIDDGVADIEVVAVDKGRG